MNWPDPETGSGVESKREPKAGANPGAEQGVCPGAGVRANVRAI